MKVKKLKDKSSKRIDHGYIQSLGIQSYDVDNLYPNTFRNIVEASSTGAECCERFSDFIEGNGFNDKLFSEYVVNRKGDTIDDIHSLICKDLAMYNGFSLHVNYDLFGNIVELNYIPFENCRMKEPDSNGYISHIAVHPDWTGRKTRNGKPIKVNKENIDFIDVFNPLRNVVLSQIQAAGGIENYKGQILWLSMAGKYTYPVGRGDSVATEMSTDEGLANVKLRNVRNNFLPSALLISKKGNESTASFDYNNKQYRKEEDDEDISYQLKRLQGDTNAGKLLEIVIGEDEEKPEFVKMNSNNYDKEFTVTDSSVIERIYSAYGQEAWHCIRIGKIGFSGDILTDAFEYYNSLVKKHQRFIERNIKRIFEHWFEVACPTNDYSVESLKYISNGAFNQP